jgi:receptor protein-tyrosine kinase
MSLIEKALAKQNAASNKQQESVDKQQDISVDEKQKNIADTDDISSGVDTSLNDHELIIDKANLAERGFLIDNGTRKSIKDEFRQVKRTLLNNAFGPISKTLSQSNLIMVSSSRPNEGKTFTAINLALSIALEQDKTVLLVDSDVLRPSITRELGIPDSNGLIEYLLDESTNVSDIIYHTNIDKLKLIPSGKPHHLSNELLASDKMAQLTKELSQRYPDRVVIFDCPPLLGITETLVLANLMGQAVIVVEESKTQIEDIKKATENLNADLAVGIVVNKSIRSHKDIYGYYGYGYGSKD